MILSYQRKRAAAMERAPSSTYITASAKPLEPGDITGFTRRRDRSIRAQPEMTAYSEIRVPLLKVSPRSQ
ncbi:MAG: hypothetical protein QXJ48_01800 [Candidatus Korarchaeum sp.]